MEASTVPPEKHNFGTETSRITTHIPFSLTPCGRQDFLHASGKHLEVINLSLAFGTWPPRFQPERERPGLLLLPQRPDEARLER